MKKLVITSVAIAVASVVSAQTVTSANIVGYSKVSAVGGQLTLCALNFDAGTANTLADLINTNLPNGSSIYLWDVSAGTYQSSLRSNRGIWSSNLVFENGDAFWIQASGTGTNELLFSGEVLTGDQVITVPDGLLMIGYGYPVGFSWQNTQISQDLANGSSVYVWDNSTQVYSSFLKSNRGVWNGNPSVGISQGFWVNNAGAQIDVNEPVPFAQ